VTARPFEKKAVAFPRERTHIPVDAEEEARDALVVAAIDAKRRCVVCALPATELIQAFRRSP
jgi:hypothetical protein